MNLKIFHILNFYIPKFKTNKQFKINFPNIYSQDPSSSKTFHFLLAPHYAQLKNCYRSESKKNKILDLFSHLLKNFFIDFIDSPKVALGQQRAIPCKYTRKLLLVGCRNKGKFVLIKKRSSPLTFFSRKKGRKKKKFHYANKWNKNW